MLQSTGGGKKLRGKDIFEMLSKMNLAEKVSSVSLQKTQVAALAKYMGRDESTLTKFGSINIKIIGENENATSK